MFARPALAFPEWFFDSSSHNDERSPRGTSFNRRGDDATDASYTDPLLVRLKSGDQSALRETHAMYTAELWRHAYRYLGDRDAAEDAVQDVFVAVWERRESLSTQLTIRAYLFAAVRNQALKQLRHRAVVAKAARVEQEDEDAFSAEHGVSSERSADEATLIALVRRAMNTLPERQRTAIELRWLRGLNYTEIAAVLGVSEAAVRKLVMKALIRLETLHQRLREP